MKPELRAAMTAAAARVARAANYTNAGTIEFLVEGDGEDGKFYFLEMNTRLQVEHPITEMVTGTDLVAWQIRIARGERLTLDPAQAATPVGHAIECRIYAEDPDARFMPSPGKILHLRAPSGPGIRDDSGVTSGFEVPIFYDSMISKLVAWGADRDQAIARMTRALGEYDVRGIKTTIPFFQWLLATDDFRGGRFDTTALDRELASRAGRPFVEVSGPLEEVAVISAALHAWFRASARHGASAAGAGAGAGFGAGNGTGAASNGGGAGVSGATRVSGLSAWQQTARREGLRG
jgi:acetyl-CoA carboxylase biotin carboxylase subunit